PDAVAVRDRSRRGRKLAGKRLEQRRFSGAVRPDDREALGSFQAKSDSAEERAVAVSMLQIVGRQHLAPRRGGLPRPHLQLPVLPRLLDTLLLQLFQDPLAAVHAAEIAVAAEALHDGLLPDDLLVLPPHGLFQLLALRALFLAVRCVIATIGPGSSALQL